MQIRKSRLKQIIQEEVANAKFIEVREDIYTDDSEQYQDDETKDANISPDNITLDELIVQEITKAMKEDATSHMRQADVLRSLARKQALTPNQKAALIYHEKEAEKEKGSLGEEDKWGGNKGDQNRSAKRGEKSLDGAEDFEPVFEEELDLEKAIDKDHEGYCTPMSKPTCTPRRKALARRLKKGGDLHKDIHGESNEKK